MAANSEFINGKFSCQNISFCVVFALFLYFIFKYLKILKIKLSVSKLRESKKKENAFKKRKINGKEKRRNPQMKT